MVEVWVIAKNGVSLAATSLASLSGQVPASGPILFWFGVVVEETRRQMTQKAFRRLGEKAVGRKNLLDNGQNPRLCIVVAVRSDTEINLLVKGIGLVCCNKTEQRVGGRQRNSGESGRRHWEFWQEVVLDGAEAGRCAG